MKNKSLSMINIATLLAAITYCGSLSAEEGTITKGTSINYTTLSEANPQSNDILMIVGGNVSFGETLFYSSDTKLVINSDNLNIVRTIKGENTLGAEKQFFKVISGNLDLTLNNVKLDIQNGFQKGTDVSNGAIYVKKDMIFSGASLFKSNIIESAGSSFICSGGAISAEGNITLNGYNEFINNKVQSTGTVGVNVYGGAISAGNKIILSGVNIFTGNQATTNINKTSQGGAIYAKEIVISGENEFKNNSAQYGGAIYAFFGDNSGSVTLSGKNTFEGNIATGDGGAISADLVTLSGENYFINNRSNLYGGAIEGNEIIFLGDESKAYFEGNKANDKANDITVYTSAGVTFQDQGEYFFDGGINTNGEIMAPAAGKLDIKNGAKVSFGDKSISIIGGNLVVDSDSKLIFKITNDSGIRDADNPVITVNGTVSVDVDSIGFTLSNLNSNVELNVCLIKQETGTLNLDLATVNVKNDFLTITTTIENENEYWANIVYSASNIDDVWGNGNASVILGGSDILDGNNDEVRHNINGLTGELVASLFHFHNNRIRDIFNHNASNQVRYLWGKLQNVNVAVISDEYSACNFQINGLVITQVEEQETPWEIDVSYYGQRGEVERYHRYNGYDYDYDGVLIDINKSISTARCGLLFDLGHTDMDAIASNLDSENYGVIAYYNQLLPYDFYSTVQIDYTYGNNEIHRYYEGRHNGDFASHAFSANLEVGKIFILSDKFMLTPYLSGTYGNFMMKGYRDDILNYYRNRLDYGDCALGIRLQKDFAVFSIPTSVKASFTWFHTLSDEQTDIYVRNIATNASAKVRGHIGERNLLKATLGVESQISSDISVGLGYSFLDNNQVNEHSFDVSVNFRF